MKIKKMSVAFNGPILRGWVYTTTYKCKNPDCPCQTDRSKRHGLYYRWSGMVDGKLRTRTISKEAAKDCQKRIDNYKALLKKIDKLVTDAIGKEPWKNIGKGSQPKR